MHFRVVPQGTPGARPLRYTFTTPVPRRWKTGRRGGRRRVDHAAALRLLRLQRRRARRHGLPVRYATTEVVVWVITDLDRVKADERAAAAERLAAERLFVASSGPSLLHRYRLMTSPLVGGSRSIVKLGGAC